MRIILQRVREASVSVEGRVTGSIEQGLLLLAGFEEMDTTLDLEWMVKKILQLRIFNDEAGRMNKSVMDTSGSLLVVSQFTLYASYKKGNRPSYLRSAKPAIAQALYEEFLSLLKSGLGKEIASGIFGADMQVSILNDGPVTILLDSKMPE